MREQMEGDRNVAAAAAKGREQFARRIDCAPPAGPGHGEAGHRAGGRGTGRLREPGAGRPDSER